MSKDSPSKSFIPAVDGRALDAVKIIAAIIMVIDHINAIWFKMGMHQLEMLGRTVFPLFCYALVMSLFRSGTAAWPKITTMLLLLAIVSEPFVQLARPDSQINVLFSLALGAAFVPLAEKMKNWQIYLCYIACGLTTALGQVQIEFGLAGIVLPSAIYLVMSGRKGLVPALLILLFTINIRGMIQAAAQGTDLLSQGTLYVVLLMGICSSMPPYAILLLTRGLAQTGRYLSKYALHVFYPLHQIILWAIGLLFFAK